MNFRSLRFRVTAWSVGFLAVALMCSSIGVFLGVKEFLSLSQQRNLRNMARNIETIFLADYGQKGEKWAVNEIQESYAGGADRYVTILHNGHVMFRSEDLRNPALPIDAIPLPEPGTEGLMQMPEIAGGLLQMVDQYTAPDGQRFTVIVGASENAAHRVLRSLAWILFIVCPLVTVLAAVACFVLMKRPLRPVLVLTEQAEHIGRDHLGERLQVPATGDELQRLATALNHMIARLEDALAHNHRFSADASHELRTPLTIVRGELEQAIQEPGLSETAVDSIGSALEEIERMSQIVQSLMATAYLDTGGEQLDREPTDLGRLVGTTIEQMRLLADERNIALVGNTLEHIAVLGNPTRLKQVVVNLVDNALKYNHEGGTVSASVYAEGESVVFRVADTGIGIPDASLPFIFDRFYRADRTRSRATGGIGVGLAIVKAICNAHNATIQVKSREGRGSVFTVTFPRVVEAPLQQLDTPAVTTPAHRAQAVASSR